uniref:Uncharacterized protein n=1 Tax=Mustela putorius furo TaxID=9669 RepID=M3Y8B9_MUSPF
METEEPNLIQTHSQSSASKGPARATANLNRNCPMTQPVTRASHRPTSQLDSTPHPGLLHPGLQCRRHPRTLRRSPKVHSALGGRSAAAAPPSASAPPVRALALSLALSLLNK